ncbi:uncharacterized protein [Coffea arabica]|uniref:Reverse transcriptase zinc-binding domain-containing protein n=1 Tax=Coffea arabica TaxID=13443 RepID=A0ABM4X7L0_COFAR
MEEDTPAKKQYSTLYQKISGRWKCILNGNWKWPCGRRWSKDVRDLMQATPDPFKPFPDMQDQTILSTSSTSTFSVKSAMKILRAWRLKVYWYKLVWGKNYVPGFAFIPCLACRRRPNTMNRIMVWGLQVSTTLLNVMCQEENETFDHLLLAIESLSLYGRRSKT